MITLSKRLQTVADFVSSATSIADVGCDHGYMSIYLYENHKANRVYAMDVNKGPLMRAQNNIEVAGYSDAIITRLSDGLKAVDLSDDIKACVICGMGGPLGLRLLYDSKVVVANMEQVVLQLQSDLPLVRFMLKKWGFEVLDETMCIDEDKYYFCIKAKPSISFVEASAPGYNPLKPSTFEDFCNDEKENIYLLDDEAFAECILPASLKKNAPLEFDNYVTKELSRMTKVRESLSSNEDSDKAILRKRSLDREIQIYERKQR